MNKLTSYTIREIQKSYADKILTPTSFVDLSLQRAKQTKELNAYVTITEDVAETHSIESEKRFYIYKKPKLLDGVTVGIKDNFCTSNIATTCASEMLKNFVPTYDATVYSRLRRAGACLIGKCNLDEFAMGSGTVDSVFGPTRNPWSYDKDKWRIAGGSSGGSAAAVCSGSCLAAIGSDTGGSTRNPAALCGVVGLKPSYGLVSRYGLIPLVNSMDVPGILARTVDDATMVLNAIAGPDKNDSTTIKRVYNPITLRDIDLSSVRIGIPKEYYCKGMSREVLETWSYVTDLLENEKAIVKSVSLPHTNISIAVYYILNQCEVASNMARYDGVQYGLRASATSSTEELYATTRHRGFNNVVRSRILAGNYFLLTKNYVKYFIKTLKLRRLIVQDFQKVFHNVDGVDLLLTPTTLTDAPLFEDFSQRTNRDQCALQDYCTQPANMAGIPAISIPIKLSENRMPLSLQLMGPPLSEDLLMNVARKIESLVQFPVLKAVT
ncbi:glutamyl-tRNA(Gln) amidotransferase subunit A, mitochondrial-like [Trichoplusia ni]|uniref:Glutamyl-tRNA(Gln) amidotransferase subunit A, mitochondrial n=1 Tax=Trichoplusia ni TaxID=7111 RepID=A0A7E5VME6_TRINI|nr:glutamyl-tRNA(Gln) amidotransferase subunit A, mitochondrial-like [Trichoplusia ni]